MPPAPTHQDNQPYKHVHVNSTKKEAPLLTESFTTPTAFKHGHEINFCTWESIKFLDFTQTKVVASIQDFNNFPNMGDHHFFNTE